MAETVAEFVAAIHKITEHCKYNDILKDMLRDHLVRELSDKHVQHWLLQETKLTYKQALDMALAAKMANRNAKHIRGVVE